MHRPETSPPIVPIEGQRKEPTGRGMIAFTAVFMTVFALVAAGWLVMALQEFSHSNNVVRLGQLGMFTLAVGAAALFELRITRYSIEPANSAFRLAFSGVIRIFCWP